MKRSLALIEIFDKIISGILLVLLFPIVIPIIILIKLEEPGAGVFYRGLRIGKDMKPFIMYKFRTLREGSESVIGGRLLNDGDRDLVTRTGRFLRKTKLDEIPQFYNVLKGEMSLIGPRPVRPLLVKDYFPRVPGYWKRFVIKPGISGPAQVFGSYYSPLVSYVVFYQDARVKESRKREN